MNREQMVERAARAILARDTHFAEEYEPTEEHRAQAAGLLDVILPQVSTAEELEALPEGTKLLEEDGAAWSLHHGGFDKGGPFLKGTTGEHRHYRVAESLPLTVVYQPEVSA